MFGESIRKSDHLIKLWYRYFWVFFTFGILVAFIPLFKKIPDPGAKYFVYAILILFAAVFGGMFGWLLFVQMVTLLTLRKEGKFFSSKTEHSEMGDWGGYLKSIGGLRKKLTAIIFFELLFWTIIGAAISIVLKLLFRKQTKAVGKMVTSKMEEEGSR